MAPLIARLPFTATLWPLPNVLKFGPGAPNEKSSTLPWARVRLVLTVKVPVGLPAARWPPFCTVTLPPTVPKPPSAAPLATLTSPATLALACDASPTVRLPPCTVVRPV